MSRDVGSEMSTKYALNVPPFSEYYLHMAFLPDLFAFGIPILQTQTVDTSPNGAAIYRFDGSSGSYINVTQELRFQPSRGFTISGWVQQDPGNSG